jgi:hypothetical protein
MPMLPPALTADWRCRSGRAEFRVLAGDDPTDHAWAGRRERGDELSEPARVGAAGSHGAEVNPDSGCPLGVVAIRNRAEAFGDEPRGHVPLPPGRQSTARRCPGQPGLADEPVGQAIQ